MSLSDVQICNIALLKFGDIQITELTDDSREARACNTLYPLLRDRLLYSFAWNFAISRADITPEITTKPSFEWDYAYVLPADTIRVLSLYSPFTTTPSKVKWVVEGGLFLTNQESDIYIKYIKQVTESGLFNPAFSNCLALLLAAELATKIKGSKTMRNELLNEFKRLALPEAYRLNAIEGNGSFTEGELPLSENNFTWQQVGRGLSLSDRIYTT